jgi:hypothetical protein
MLCLFTAEFQFPEARLVAASAIDNVLVRDFIVISLAPSMRENGVPLWNLVLLERLQAVAAVVVKLEQAHSRRLIAVMAWSTRERVYQMEFTISIALFDCDARENAS